MDEFRINVDKDDELVIEAYDGYTDEWTVEAFLIPTGWAADDGFRAFEEIMCQFEEVTEAAWKKLEELRS